MLIRKLESNEEPPMELLLSADPSKEIIEEYLLRGDCYVAERDNQIMGTYVLVATKPDTIELINIAVAENHSGKGFGKQLIKDSIKRAATKGYKIMEVRTGNSSIGQLALYQKCGFRIDGVDKDFFLQRYSEVIWENDIHCRDMIRLSLQL
ncbi:GNAT family N-acetyltransferase [Desemzia sp. FAM 24101]|uniref:GNAT family N-acetyltransferase n=1 Tax=unclassified Desemzia TaxID=2685243 RepID=UPI003889F7D0